MNKPDHPAVAFFNKVIGDHINWSEFWRAIGEYDAHNILIERFEDDSPRGKLSITITCDGDMWLGTVDDPDSPHRNGTVRFCTRPGGGKSERVFMALRILAVAMAADNAEFPERNPHK